MKLTVWRQNFTNVPLGWELSSSIQCNGSRLAQVRAQVTSVHLVNIMFVYSWICWRLRGRRSCRSAPSPFSAAGGGTSAADAASVSGLRLSSKQVNTQWADHGDAVDLTVWPDCLVTWSQLVESEPSWHAAKQESSCDYLLMTCSFEAALWMGDYGCLNQHCRRPGYSV